MPAANPNWGELVTATLANRMKRVADTVSRNNILYSELRRRGKIRTEGGGYVISTPIMAGEENANFQWYYGNEALNVAQQEVLTSAEYPWKQYACGVSISGVEMLMNSGRSQVINMMQARTQHAEKTIANQMHKSGHGDGTNNMGKEFGGMGLLISTTAGATVAGINSGLSTWWDNQRVITGAAPSTSTIYANMLNAQMKATRGTDAPELIIADNTWYATYVVSLQANQRFMDGRLAKAGFQNVQFQNAAVVFDGGMGGYAPAGMKFLNLDTIQIVMHAQRNNVVIGGPRRPLNEDSDTVIIAGMGNFVCTNRMLNSVLAQ